MEAPNYNQENNKNNRKTKLEVNPNNEQKNEPPKKKRKIDEEEEKEKQALFDKIKQHPELSHIPEAIDDGDEDLLAMLLDEPNMLDAMIQMKSIFEKHAGIQKQQNDKQDEQDEQEKEEITQLKKAKTINNKWFKANNATDIIKQTRDEFNFEAASRKSIGCLVNNIVAAQYKLELSMEICDEIELLSLNDETINIIEINADSFGSDINDLMSEDINYVENNLLNNTKFNMKHCLFTPYFEHECFTNNSNIIDCNKQQIYLNNNTHLHGDKIKCGDIIHVECTSRCTEFSNLWFIVDSDNITLRRIGITKTGQYIQDAHIIIPGFVTSHLFDPIKLYSTFIHHHTYSDAGGVIEIELQMSKKAIIFNEKYKYLMNNMNDKQAKTIIATYGWKQKDWSNKLRKNKQLIQDMENEQYYTIYIKTDAGSSGALIGKCNHPKIDKINLSGLCNKDATFGYIVKYKNNKKNNKILNEDQVNALLLQLDSEIKIEQVSKCLKRGISFGVVIIDKEKGLDTILHTGQCILCSKTLSCTIKNVLYQPDYGGNDYELGAPEGAIQCKETDDCCGMYVTSMCNGSIHFDSGKFHNHCTECPNMGQCIYDYRNAHCYECADHYFAGAFGNNACPNCKMTFKF